MTVMSCDTKLYALLIASSYFMAQKPITCLNISVMILCVLRIGWFSFSHTQLSSLHYSTHAVPSVFLTRSRRPYICCYLNVIIYIYILPLLPLPPGLALSLSSCSTRCWLIPSLDQLPQQLLALLHRL